MNILIHQLPRTLDVGGVETAIDPDFRTCLRIILAYEDDELTQVERHLILLENLYYDPPEDVQAAIEKGMWFLNGSKENGSQEDQEEALRLYSFGHDADLIFAAFMQIHKIDLETTDLHWWKFVSLFMAILGTEGPFGNLIGLRKRLQDGTATKEERQAAAESKDLVELPQPDTRTPEEKQAEETFMKLVKHGN